jgi:hypothetical protein
MFSLLHYFPKSSFTNLLIPRATHIFSELKTSNKCVSEIIYLNNSMGHISRTNNSLWKDNYYNNYLETESSVKYSEDPHIIKERIRVTVKNYSELEISLDYLLELKLYEGDKPVYLLNINNHKYEIVRTEKLQGLDLDQYFSNNVKVLRNKIQLESNYKLF